MVDQDIFLRHVVNDTRSFKIETFEKALRIINTPKKGVIVFCIDKFEMLVTKVKQMRIQIDEEEVNHYF